MTDRELMQQALEALELLAKYENPSTKIQVRKPRDGGPIVTMYPHKVATDAAALLRERLAQPKQEPVAWLIVHKSTGERFLSTQPNNWDSMDCFKHPLYTTPPQRKPLTDEEIKRMAAKWFLSMYWPLCNTFARAIEAKLKEKNT